MTIRAIPSTEERGEALNGNGTTPLGSTTGTTANHVSDTGGQSDGDSTSCGPTNGVGTPSSTAAFEEAYSFGYKEGYTSGYTKSYLELKHQPIAIIGMSCRFPGSVSTPDEFWELLARSRSKFSGIPSSRFSPERFFHPNPGKSGTTNARGGNFLTHDIKVFDAPFFGFTQQEAISLDPQQRLLLECTFEGLESAGIPKHSIVGTDVGVFVGGTFSEYEADLLRDPETIPMHQATGCAMAMQSNRISHFFDLRGPSFTVDTACSSSLVALHTACLSLRHGESSMALAAGVHLNMLPEFWISYSMSRLFGEEGRSFAFDERGTGYGRGEGCGMVILKLLDQAIKDNDPIRAVIAGSGINQDGKTPGITMPNGSAQEALIRSVYRNGGMDPRDTGYVEAHGTGTRVGDPIEVGALHTVFSEGRTKRKPLYIGSVKSNIGHLEAAAGIAGVIKTALMLERGFILPNHDFKQPNEKIPFEDWSMQVATRQHLWPMGKRWASVNGFGFGGTNAHIVMTRGPLDRKIMKDNIDIQISKRLFLVSANDKTSTEKAMQNLALYLEQRPDFFQHDLMSNLAYTLGQRKSLLPWRIAITASSSAELVETLSNGKVIPAKQRLEEPQIGWIFTGQGAQWWAMGRELYQHYPIYASALDRADQYLRSIGAEFSLLNELQKSEETTNVNAAHISQPSCTAVQLALVDLIKSWGASPSAVAGHSSGEIGAAYAAGLLTFEDSMTIAYHRGRLTPILKKRFPNLDGSMLAVGAGEAEIAPLIEMIPSSRGNARIACVNSPSSVTVSGDTEAVTELQSLIEKVHPGMFARKLQVDTAYHSHHMNLVAKNYTESLLNIGSPKSSRVRFYSSLLSRLATGNELDAAYWARNLTCAVQFDAAIQRMCQPFQDCKSGVDLLIELGPHAALQGPIKQILKHVGGPASKIAYYSVLSRKQDAVQTTLALAGALFLKGVALNMDAINFPKPMDRPPQVLTDLPRYPWNHSTSFYHESRLTKIHKHHAASRNDIIGVLAPYTNDSEPTWRNIVRLDDLPWLSHYQIQGVTIFPISGFVAMALEAMAQRASLREVQYERIEVDGLKVTAPVMLTEDELEMTITLRSDSENPKDELCHKFDICSCSETKGWTEHCTGRVCVAFGHINEVDGVRTQHVKAQKMQVRIASIAQADTQQVDAKSVYRQLSEIGVSYGVAFRGLRNSHASCCTATAQIIPPNIASEMPHHKETSYILHPAFLEQLISMYWLCFNTNKTLDTVHLPSAIGKITISSKLGSNLQDTTCGLRAYCEASESLSNITPNTLSMFAVGNTNKAMISVDDLVVSPILEKSVDAETESIRELCYKLDWEEMQHHSNGKENGALWFQLDAEVVVIHDESAKQRKIASRISNHLIESFGRTPSSGSLRSMAASSRNKLCIFITELERPVLANLDAPDFEALQQLLTSVQGLLWVVHSAYAGSTNPNANMISGLSRTLRSEGTLLKFATLDLDVPSKSSHDVASSVIKVFTRVFAVNSTTEETEFMQRDGKLYTPRTVNDDS